MLAICLRKFEAMIHSGKSTYFKSKPCYNWSFNFFLLLFFLIMLSGLQDLSSLTRDQTPATCSGSVEF